MTDRDKDFEGDFVLEKHRRLIRQKKWLKRIYVDFYRQMKQVKVIAGKKIEIGSGAGFIKKIIPDAITSDVVAGKGIDLVFKAEKMPTKNSEVAVFYLLNVLHHIKNVKKTFQEMERSLKPGGKVIMIEPCNTWWSRIIYRFHQENFNPKTNWKISGQGRLSDSNIALPWIIFIRDRKKFSRLFPKLKIVRIELSTPIMYLISGGLTWPQLLPTRFYLVFKRLDKILNRCFPQFAMFMTVELEKTH